MDNLVSSLERAPRRLRVIYVLPIMERDLLEAGRFRLVRSVPM